MLAFRPTTTGRRSSPRPPRSDSFQLPCSRRLTRKPPREEITRVAKLGFREANFLVNDVTIDMYLKPWDVFWDAAEETNIVVSYHVGGNRQGRGGGIQAGSAPDDFRYGTRQRRDFVFQSLCQSFQLRNIGATS